jgi:hypothetical protein
VSVSVHEREVDLMSNMFQLLTMMAVPAAFFVTCRYLNLRGDRAQAAPHREIGAMASSPRS